MHTPQGDIQNPFKDPGDLAEEAAALRAETLVAIDGWAERTAAHPQGPEWRKQGERLLAEKRAGAIAHYAYASLLAALGDDEDATRQLVVLCERLSQVAAWEAIGEIAARALDRGAGAAAARWLVRAGDETGGSEKSYAALERAHEAVPGEPRIAWRLAQELEARGERDAAVRTTARTLEAMARKRDAEALDDVLLHLLEKPDARTMRLVFDPLRTFVKSGETERVADFLEMAWSAIVELGLASECWQALRQMVVEAQRPAPLVRLLPAAAEAGLEQGAEARRLLALTGIETGTGAAEALDLFDRLLPFAVGAYAEHQSWGAGRVTEVTPEEVWLDFPDKPAHRMTLRAAHQALSPVAADDLVVLGSRDPSKLEALRAEDPVELVVRALKRLQGEATTTELKRVLVHYAVPEKEWTRFWNAAKGKFAADPRLDDTQAYRKIYRLAAARGAADESGADDSELPAFDRRANARKTLATLGRFLKQHPGSTARLVERRGAVLRAWAGDSDLAWRERLQALIVLGEGQDPDSLERAPGLAGEAFAAGFDIRDLSAAEDQARVLGWALGSDHWQAAARAALGSRFVEVRQPALDACHERLGDRRAAFFSDVAREARQGPEPALFLAQLAYGSRTPAAESAVRLDPWAVAVGLAELLEGGATGPQTRSALSLLAPDGPLARAARQQPAEPESVRTLDRLVAHWRGSDRTLHPYLDWLEAVGLSEPVQFARGKRRQAARAVTQKGGPVALHERRRPYFTRATYQRLRDEAEQLQQALRTTIPQAIQKAREHGDLRENAEYESAKLKQRQAQSRLEQLAERIEDALLIDDLEIDEGKAGLGTEIDIEFSDGRRRRVWLLGEGDDALGDEVVSYRAPLGRVLLDRSPGDQVEIPTDGSTETATVRAVRRRLPTETGQQSAAD